MVRVGISHAKIHSMLSVIQDTIHRVCTYFGEYPLTYGGDHLLDWLNEVQGVLQGNAAGPTIWSLLSSLNLNVLHTREFCGRILYLYF